MSWQLQKLPYPDDLETKKVLKMLPEAHRALNQLSQDDLLEKQKMGKYNYYINKYLTEIFSS